jgi:hypothetical protein
VLLAHSRRLREILAAGRQQISAGEGLSHDQFWGAVNGPPVAEDTEP